MAFDRSKFRASSVDDLKQQKEEFEKKMNFSSNSRPGFLKITEGLNVLRIYPAHEGEKTFMQPCTRHWLDVEVTYTNKDGKEVTEVKRKPIFSGIAHSKHQRCPIDAYIKTLVKVAGEEYQDKKEYEAFIAPIKGKNGITGRTKWIAYVGKGTEFGRMELPTSVKNAMNKLAFGQTTKSGVVSTDPFTDPDTGRCAMVTYNSQKSIPEAQRKADDYYSTSIDLNEVTMLTDEQLEMFDNQPSLTELYADVYTRKDFDLAVEGLKRFDEANGFGIFSIDSFLDELEDIYDILPEPSKDDSEDDEENESDSEEVKEDKAEAKVDRRQSTRRTKSAPKKEVESDSEESGDLPWEVELEDMSMDELKSFIRRNELPVRISARTTKEDTIEWIKEELEIKEKESNAAAKEEAAEETEEKPARRSGRGGRRNLSSINEALNS